MNKQQRLDEVYMEMAKTLSKLSYATRHKVGCIIVKDTQIISEGYNGTPSGFSNTCEYMDWTEQEKTKPEVLHAESNAIAKLARSTNSSQDATLYVTLSPCFQCSKLIIQAGITRVVYSEEYRNTEGLQLLKQANIEVVQL